MSTITGNTATPIYEKKWEEPTESESKIQKLINDFDELKANSDRLYRNLVAKDRRLLYAIAEKLGIDVDNI